MVNMINMINMTTRLFNKIIYNAGICDYAK
jgi:hypothetical protein